VNVCCFFFQNFGILGKVICGCSCMYTHIPSIFLNLFSCNSFVHCPILSASWSAPYLAFSSACRVHGGPTVSIPPLPSQMTTGDPCNHNFFALSLHWAPASYPGPRSKLDDVLLDIVPLALCTFWLISPSYTTSSPSASLFAQSTPSRHMVSLWIKPCTNFNPTLSEAHSRATQMSNVF
jgi:hypothetical protein